MKPLLGSVQRKNAVVLCGAVLVCLPLGAQSAFSALLGGMIQAASLWSLERSVRTWLSRAQNGESVNASAATWLRLPALLGTVAAALYALPIDPVGFAIGLSVVVPAALWHGLVPASEEV